MNATTPDLAAAAADRRQHQLAVLEGKARTWTGPLLCTLCGGHLNPVGRRAIPCRCPDPQVQTVDERVKDLAGMVAFLEEELTATRARLREMTVLAAENAGMLEMSRAHAADLEALLAFERGHVARFVQRVEDILAAAALVSSPAVQLAGMLRQG